VDLACVIIAAALSKGKFAKVDLAFMKMSVRHIIYVSL